MIAYYGSDELTADRLLLALEALNPCQDLVVLHRGWESSRLDQAGEVIRVMPDGGVCFAVGSNCRWFSTRAPMSSISKALWQRRNMTAGAALGVLNLRPPSFPVTVPQQGPMTYSQMLREIEWSGVLPREQCLLGYPPMLAAMGMDLRCSSVALCLGGRFEHLFLDEGPVGRQLNDLELLILDTADPAAGGTLKARLTFKTAVKVEDTPYRSGGFALTLTDDRRRESISIVLVSPVAVNDRRLREDLKSMWGGKSEICLAKPGGSFLLRNLGQVADVHIHGVEFDAADFPLQVFSRLKFSAVVSAA